MSLDLTPAEVGIVDDELLPPLPVAEPVMARRTLWIMSAACGVTVANSYYNQPLLSDFQAYFHTSAERASLVATAAQVGYGTGIFFLVPLGDLMERRRLVLTILCLCAALLLGMAMAPTIQALIAFQLVVAITGVSAQLLIPFGIELTPPEKRGSTVGVLMAGLLCGILLARTVAGLLGDYFGWRSAYFVGCGATAITAVMLFADLPHRPPTLKMKYPRLLHSMIDLIRTQPPLWPASLVSALSFGGFTAFWTTLSFLMKSRFGYGAGAAGMFGIVGLVGALAAPLAGKLSDRRGPPFTVTLSLISSAAAFALMWISPSIPGLIIGVLLMDLGVQSIQVAEQSLVIALVPTARNRINCLYMVARFLGGAGGSLLGAAAWGRYGWPGVCTVCIALLAIGIVIHFVGPRPAKSLAR